MAETQALGATGLNACGSVSALGTSPVPGEQNNFNVAFVVAPAPGQYQIKLFNPIPRAMGMIHVTLNDPLVAGLSWRLLAWTDAGLITIEIDLGAVPTASSFEFDVVQTNLDSANSL